MGCGAGLSWGRDIGDLLDLFSGGQRQASKAQWLPFGQGSISKTELGDMLLGAGKI